MRKRKGGLAAPAILIALACTGCSRAVVLNPAGDVAAQQRDLLISSTALMLLIIVPVMALTVFFAWRYRKSNTRAAYDPEWDHSTHLELVIWAAPLGIIICLGALTWLGTHTLDPYRSLDRVSASQTVDNETTPLRVQVVALDWKWLFLYPDFNVASLNELAIPVDRPVSFEITAQSVMNSFYAPALAGQIYAMPGMQTRLHAVLNRPGDSVGFSANYSGHGFSGMRFRLRGMESDDFDIWVARARATGAPLDRGAFNRLAEPSENEPPRLFSSVESGLYHATLNLCIRPGAMCMDEMMAIDARGGVPIANIMLAQAESGQDYLRAGYFCAKPTPSSGAPMTLAARSRTPLLGAGLEAPTAWSRPLSFSALDDAQSSATLR